MARDIDAKTIELSVNTIKGLAMDGVEKAQSGHPGTPMGLADISFELFARTMRFDPKDPKWIARDRFVLSAGHASMLIYSMLHLSGYDLPMSELQRFRQWESKTPGHPEAHLTPGVETTTGPLGQGVGNAVGMALALALKAQRFPGVFDGARVYGICSDGDVMEGVSAEASSIAGHLGLSNLVLFYDDNKITIEGDTDLAFTEDVGKRYEAYGWYVQRIDGHDGITWVGRGTHEIVDHGSRESTPRGNGALRITRHHNPAVPNQRVHFSFRDSATADLFSA